MRRLPARQLAVQRAIVRTHSIFILHCVFTGKDVPMNDPYTSSTDLPETPEAIRAELHALTYR